jgi:serine/threonine protein kinase
VHRDLKPENILIGKGEGPIEHRIKIVDFGVSTEYKSTMFQDNLDKIGTLIYMAPEQTTS